MKFHSWIILIAISAPSSLLATTNDCDKNFEKELLENPHRMEKRRGLQRYESDSFAGSPFMDIVRALPSDFLMVENGPGVGLAAIDILSSPELGKAGKMILVDRVKPADVELAAAEKKFGPRLHYLADKTIEQRITDGSLNFALNRADLVVGSYASETYVPDMGDSIGKNLTLTKIGGKYIFNVVWMSISRNPKLMTTIRPANNTGEEGDYGDIPFRTFGAWLSQIKGAKVVHFSNSGFNDINYIVVLERTGQEIVMPPLERKIYETNYAPPRRLYIAPTVTLPKQI